MVRQTLHPQNDHSRGGWKSIRGWEYNGGRGREFTSRVPGGPNPVLCSSLDLGPTDLIFHHWSPPDDSFVLEWQLVEE